MTEKEHQSTISHEQARRRDRHAEDEISFMDVLEVLLKHQVLILSITTIFTLFSIFYVQLIIPTYRATIGFLEPQETFSSILPKGITEELPHSTTTGGEKSNVSNENINEKPSAFSMFLSKVMSYKLKKEVFEKGDFLQKFYGTDSINLEHAVLGIHNSISITKEKNDANLPSFVKPIYLKMDGTKPKVMSEFLTALTQSAIHEVRVEIKDLAKFLVATEINRITTEIDTVRALSEDKKARNLLRLSEALEIAKNLGVKDHNFNIQKNSSFHLAISDNKVEIHDTSLPTWFLYGENALQQELAILKSRKNATTDIEQAENEAILKKYKAINPSSLKVKVVTISQPSIPPSEPLKGNRRKVIAMGMALGLLIGLIIAFVCNLMDRMKENISPASTTKHLG